MTMALRPRWGLLPCLLAAWLTVAHAADGGGPFTVEDLVMLKRLSDPQVAPGGRFLVFVLRETDLAANKGHTALWFLGLDPPSEPRRLTDATNSDSSPRFAPDGRTLYFLSARSGRTQVWKLVLPGGTAQRITDFPLDVGSLKVSPRGDRLAVTMEVFPDCPTLQCSRERLDASDKDKATGRIYQRLFVRHWDVWADGTRSHLFSVALNGSGSSGTPVDVSRGLDADIPSKPFGDDEDYAFSPDGRTLVFSARIADHSEPWSTNFDLFQVPADGSAAPLDITSANPAWDAHPVFLANGDLAWAAQERPGFESDRFHIMLREHGSNRVRALTASWDRSVQHLGVSADGQALLATVDELGQRVIYRVDPHSGVPSRLTSSGTVSTFSAAPGRVVYAAADLSTPDDLYAVPLRGGTPQRLTSVNRELLAARQLAAAQQFSFAGWHGERVYGYVLQPYGFSSAERYPIAFLVHGGPQVSMQNLWTYRWNAQAFAAAGYGVVMIDFHGSPGYGQAFTDSISRDWGGKPLTDLQLGLAAALAKFPWLDGERACALGASYGGFMMNWIEGNWPQGFRCIVNHDGVFDQRMMYYSTDELWFPEWEFGAPYYQDPQAYERVNPVDFVAQWRTPMLEIHGELDYRIPYSQGLGAFSALQRRGIESRLLVFPDENHWVLKPANSLLWYQSVLGWLDEHLKK